MCAPGGLRRRGRDQPLECSHAPPGPLHRPLPPGVSRGRLSSLSAVTPIDCLVGALMRLSEGPLVNCLHLGGISAT